MTPCAFRVLGPLQIAGQPPELPRQAQVLLGVLLLRANEIVSPHRLSDEIWGDRPPASGTNAVQVYVSRLRKAIELAGVDASITRHPAGYVIETAPDAVDWLVYLSTLAAAGDARAADPARAAELLRDALALWRGPVLAGLTFESITATEIAQLEESRLAAVERRIDHDLELGREREVVAELPALIVEHPFRESLRCKLALALYRSGRQAEALEECRRATRFLREELGLDPSPALRELEQAVLRHDPALTPAPAVPAGRPRSGGRGSRRPAAILCLAVDDDLLPDRDPELVDDVLDRWHERLAGALERRGAAVLPPAAGEIVAVFGLRQVREDDLLRACRAALEVRGEHAGLAEELVLGDALALRGAVEVGEVAPAEGGSGPVGAVLARTRRLAARAPRGEIVLGEAARALAGDGVATAGDGGTLVAVQRLAEAIPRQLQRPLVGRATELRALHRRFEECLEWSLPGLTVLVGPAGIGKSRLVAELVAGAAGGARVLRARCLPDEQGVAFAPLQDLVADLRTRHGREGLEALVAGTGDGDAAATVARFLALSGEGEATSTREETFLAVRMVFEGLAAGEPLLVVVEDLHWAEPTLVDLLEDVVGAGAGPIAVVATSRTDVLDERPELAAEHPRCSAIMLAPLPEAACLELVDTIPTAGGLSAESRARIVHASGGNPLFIEQLAAMSGPSGAGGDAVSVPPTLRALLLARVDRLDDAERTAIEVASVLGESFRPDEVAALAAPPETGLVPDALLAGLVDKDVLRSSERAAGAYTIAHPLLRTTVYESVPKLRRAELHERLASRSAEAGEERTDEFVGHHLERAFRFRVEASVGDEGLAELGARARARLAAAGRRSLTLGDVSTAVNLLSRALAATVDPADVPPALALVLGDALREAGRLSEAEEALQRGLAAARARDERALEWRTQASIVRVRLQLHGDDLDEVRELARETLERLTELEDAQGLSVAWWTQAWLAWLGCRAAETEQALARAIECAQAAGDQRAEAHSTNLFLGAGLFGPLPVDQAIDRCLTMRERHRARPRLVASANRALCVLRAMEGAFDEARDLATLDRRTLGELGMHYLAAAASEAHGLVELLAGEPAAAEAVLREGYEALVAMGDRSALPTVAAMLGESLFQLERYAEAVAVTTAAEREADADDLQAQVQWRVAQAKALAARGHGKKAVATADRACALAAGTDFLNLQGDAFAALGEVRRRLGHAPEAISAFDRAGDLYERKGNVVAASRVRVLGRALAGKAPPAGRRSRKAG